MKTEKKNIVTTRMFLPHPDVLESDKHNCETDRTCSHIWTFTALDKWGWPVVEVSHLPRLAALIPT